MSDQSIIDAIDASPLNRGLDGASWLASPGNIAIEIGDNIVLYDWHGDDTFEGHLLLVSKGRLAVMAVRESFHRMFEDHAAETLFGLVPDFHRAAKMVLRWAGAKFVGQRATPEGMCDLFVISKDMWEVQKS